jgi:hypothetical protein
MGVLDGPLGKVTSSVIGTFGRPATFRRPAGGDYNPATGDVDGSTDGDTPCSISFVGFGQTSIPDTLIQAGDRAALVPRVDITVQPIPRSDQIIEGGRTWEIEHVSGISTGEQEAMYECLLRGA